MGSSPIRVTKRKAGNKDNWYNQSASAGYVGSIPALILAFYMA